MSDPTLNPALQRLIREHFPGAPEHLTAELRFKQDLRGDSLSFVELVTDLERELQVKLPDDLAATARTVGQLAALVRHYQDSAVSLPTAAARPPGTASAPDRRTNG